MASQNRLARIILTLATCAGLAACDASGMKVPPGALVSCTRDADCPSGTFCKQALQRCVSSSNADQTPPGVVGGSVEITPDVVAAGATLAITFDSDEPLAGAPVVDLVTQAGRHRATVVSSDGTHHVLSVAPGGADAEGLAEVRAQLVDPSGNLTRDAAVGTVTLDFTPPALLPGSAAVEVTPAPESPLRTADALGAGATARVSFTMNEALAGHPVVTAAGSPALPLEFVSQAGTTFLYRLALDATPRPRETRTLRVSALDVAGNGAQDLALEVPLVIDGTPPAAPVATSGAAPVIELTRAPWGAAPTLGTANFSMAGSPGAVEADATVVLYDGATAGAFEVGRVRAGADGAFATPLLADPPEVWAEAVDDAGNAGPRTRIVDVTWIASLGNKVAGQATANPNRLELRRWFLGTLEQPDAVEVSQAEVGGEGDGKVLATAGAGAWFPLARPGGAGYRLLPAIGHDPGLGRTVLFGGRDQAFAWHGDTWEWDGWRWSPLTVADPEGDGSPTATAGWIAGYDGHTRGVVLLDGNAMWSWNGKSWRKVAGFGAIPPYRISGVAAWDARRRVLVVTSGYAMEDTWEWNGLRFAQVAGPAAPRPTARGEAAAAFDGAGQEVVLFGGRSGSTGALFGDTWSWNGTAWKDLGISGPSARSAALLAYDEVRGELVLFGGQDLNGPSNETWALRRNGGTPAWTKLTPTDPERDGNPGWDNGSLVWNANRGVATYVSTLGATWDWNGASWALRAPTDPEGDGNPAGSIGIPLAGQAGGGTSTLFNWGTTWLWNGASWASYTPATRPNAYTQSCLVFDPGSGKTLLFGGYNGATFAESWALGLGPVAWTNVTPAVPGASPSARTYARCATHEALGVPVLFGGSDSVTDYPRTIILNDTWVWSAGVWKKVTFTGTVPSGSLGNDSNFTYDPVRQRMVFLQQGPYPRGTYWELAVVASGGGYQGTWTPTAPADPEGDGNALSGRLAFEPGRGEVASVEGTAPPGVWLWNRTTTSWARVPSANPLGLGGPDSSEPSVTSDPATGRILAVASEPWTWDPGLRATPAHVLHVAYSASGGPDPAACADGPASCPLREVRVRWVGGADDPAGSAGAALRAWTGGWTTLASGPGSAGSPAAVTFGSAGGGGAPALDARALGALFSGPSRELVLALVPSGAAPLSSSQVRRVATDAVEVVVRYRKTPLP